MYGWVCYKCGKSYSQLVTQCEYCNNIKYVTSDKCYEECKDCGNTEEKLAIAIEALEFYKKGLHYEIVNSFIVLIDSGQIATEALEKIK